MKKFALLLVMCFMVGCSKKEEVVVETIPDGEMDMSAERNYFEKHFNEVSIDGEFFKIPIAARDFYEKTGTKLADDNTPLVTPGNSVQKTLVGDIGEVIVDYRMRGDAFGLPLDDSDITMLVWDRNTFDGTDIMFYGGITPDTTKEEIGALLGVEYDNGDTAQFSRKADSEGKQKITAYYEKDKLMKVEVINYSDYDQEISYNKYSYGNPLNPYNGLPKINGHEWWEGIPTTR